MDYFFSGESPLIQKISFNKLMESYEQLLESDQSHLKERARAVLSAVEPYPELREGFTDLSLLEKHRDLIRFVLEDSFSKVLTSNEIKMASAPFSSIIFNSSDRFDRILKEAGPDYELSIQNLEDGIGYILQCIVVLGFYGGFKVDFKRPLFYDIPDSQGIMRRYRLLYNADFIELIPTDKAKKLTEDDLHELMEDFNNLDLWKEKIPPGSYVSKGFVIGNMFDVTAEHSISEIKSRLIETKPSNESQYLEDFHETFRSLFNLKSIRMGFTGFSQETRELYSMVDKNMDSFLLVKEEKMDSKEVLDCPVSFRKLMKEKKYYVLSNLEKTVLQNPGVDPYQGLYDQGFRSVILAPIAPHETLLGFMELVSETPYELNTFNATKLDNVLPFIAAAVKRTMEEEENRIDAIIQHECTTVHPSVYWKFREEAHSFIHRQETEEHPVFRDIVFPEVYPLYGQVDIKESSRERNISIQKDLQIQLSEAQDVLSEAQKYKSFPVYGELLHRIDDYMREVRESLLTQTEQLVYDFLREEIDPLFDHFLELGNDALDTAVENYRSGIDKNTGTYYDHRRNYDQSVYTINSEMAAVIDELQNEAQGMYPHYFERYKTDGVEHNLYIGKSISPHTPFHPTYLSNLRIWQLQAICEMENRHHRVKAKLPVKLDVASLVLVYSTPLAIRFRMDEKRFDVDGTYNARYEIIKKRIDKSYIKGTEERLTQKGKLSIVYSQRKDEREYLRYLSYLRELGYVSDQIEILELEGLQGVSGLKAIRAEILYTAEESDGRPRTFQELSQGIQALSN